MAVTGSAFPGITPGQRPAGQPELYSIPEASSQTGTLGAPVTLDASGNVAELATNGTLIFGFMAGKQANLATARAKNSAVYKIHPGSRFEGALSVTSWDQSYVGSKVALQKISSTWVLATLTSISSIAQAVVLGLANPSVFSTGDSTPTVIFSILAADIQGQV